MNSFTEGDVVIHKKTGGRYIILVSNAHLEKTLESHVVYQSLEDKRVWVRPMLEMFDGRFTKEEK